MTYDDWLEQPFQEAEARLEAIEIRTEELLSDEWDTKNIDVFVAAIECGALDAYRSDIASAINNSLATTALLGELVWFAVNDYCRIQAETQATNEIDQRKKS
jgi:hypothetical protein